LEILGIAWPVVSHEDPAKLSMIFGSRQSPHWSQTWVDWQLQLDPELEPPAPDDEVLTPEDDAVPELLVTPLEVTPELVPLLEAVPPLEVPLAPLAVPELEVDVAPELPLEPPPHRLSAVTQVNP
jgi:hypothetical protein